MARDSGQNQTRPLDPVLFLNAFAAMEGGGTLRVSLARQDDRTIRISVSDTGTGIPKEDLPRVFDPYFTTRQDRSGLGLATTYSIMKRHGGRITVESEAGVGTLFSLYLPAMAGKDAEKEQP